MAQLECMNACLDTLSTKLYQVNTRVSCIAQRQACIGGFTMSPSPSPSLQALEDGNDDHGSGGDDDDEDKDVGSSDYKEMTTSQ